MWVAGLAQHMILLTLALTSSPSCLAAVPSTSLLPSSSSSSSSSSSLAKYVNVNLLPRLNDVNIVVLTDVHAWVSGHGLHEPDLNADYGDILSFYQHLKTAADKAQTEIFLVNNGDFLDGTGLSQVPPEHLVPILLRMPFSAVNVGNHEVFYNETIEYLRTSGFIDHWNGTYLSSNTVWAETGQPIGDRYTFWTCQFHQEPCSILVFGFLFNYDLFCKNTRVETVQEIIQQSWFKDVLRQGEFDSIVVMAHMDYVDPLVRVLHRAIRRIVGPDMLIQFINGHSHRRGFKLLDPLASSFEAGGFLDTVGFISFPLRSAGNTTRTTARTNSIAATAYPANVTLSESNTSVFEPVFLDTSTTVLSKALGGGDTRCGLVKTQDGHDLSRLIDDTLVSMGLTRVVGCSNTTYSLQNTSLTDPDSLWGLYMNQVIPSTLFNSNNNASKVFIQSTLAFKANLWIGNVTVDDLIHVSPYDDPIYIVANPISGANLTIVLQRLAASDTNPRLPKLPQIAMSGTTTFIDSTLSTRLVPNKLYELYAAELYATKWVTSMLVPVVANVTGQYDVSPILFMQHKHDKPPRQWTTGRVWREFVTKSWPCTTVTVFAHDPPDRQVNNGSTLWHVLAVLCLTSLIAWTVNLLRSKKRLSSSPQTPTLDTCGETERRIDETSGLRLADKESYEGTV